MRSVGYVYVGGLTAVLATLGLQSAADSGPLPETALEPAVSVQAIVAPASALSESSSAVATVRAEPIRIQAQVARPPEPPQEVQSQEAPRRRSRRRSRNRYPGPIPTPADWRAPDGPVKIALQAGHWRANEAPRELSGLRDNGTAWNGTAEWEANLAIAERAGSMLEEYGYEVDILPAVVPPSYRAHLFISIHADGSNDPNASGFRVASPSRDATGRASRAASLLEQSYSEATGLRRLGDTTRRMRNYYAFNFRRYEHALHPMTIGVILETGFLTSSSDRRVIMSDPDRAARGIVDAVVQFPETPPPVVAAGGR